MKRIIVFLLVVLPLSFVHADIIVKQSGENLENVSVKSITDAEIIYLLNGVEASISKSEASAILYEDGRYEEIKSGASANPSENVEPAVDIDAAVAAGAKVYNVYAFGVHAGIGYFAKPEYDGTTVEYRVIYKSQGGDPEFKYLGTAPFAFVTEKAINSPINAILRNMMTENPLVIPNAKDVKKIEFRLSLGGYQTVVVKPIKDVLLAGGPVLLLPMNKLKKLK